jgi:RNA polymerase sigma-70 factor (ECF subfamily)
VESEALELLLEKMRRGDLQAAEEVFTAYGPELRLMVRRRLSRRLRAKFDSVDVVQSVWVHVLQAVRECGCNISSKAHLGNFLVRVTGNCLTDRLRHYRTSLECERPFSDRVRAVAAVSGQPRPSEMAVADELWENMLAACPAKYHELLRLKRQGLGLAEIAERTGLHPDSVRRIIRKLARALAFSDGV